MATFDDFFPYRGTTTALKLSRALASGRPDGPRLLLLHGPPGVGKTHLLHAIAQSVRLRSPPIAVVQTTATDLVHEMIALLRRDRAVDVRRLLPPCALVTIDDLHVLARMAATQREVGLLFRTAIEGGGRRACAAGCRPQQVPILFETLAALPTARFLELPRPSSRDVRRILRQMTKREGLTLRTEALASTATHCCGDLRRALSALAHRRLELATAR